jgi:hypothetical protein
MNALKRKMDDGNRHMEVGIDKMQKELEANFSQETQAIKDQLKTLNGESQKHQQETQLLLAKIDGESQKQLKEETQALKGQLTKLNEDTLALQGQLTEILQILRSKP